MDTVDLMSASVIILFDPLDLQWLSLILQNCMYYVLKENFKKKRKNHLHVLIVASLSPGLRFFCNSYGYI